MVSRESMEMTVGAPLDNQVSSSGQGTSFGYARSFDRPGFLLSNRIPRLENALAGILWNIPITGRIACKLRRQRLGIPMILVDALIPERVCHFHGGHIHESRQRAE